MGATLPHPITSKVLRWDGNENYLIGAAEMHGWRIHMEDAMTIRLRLSEKHPNLSMFGVYDGHRGSRCSKYLEDYLPTVVGELDNPCGEKELTKAMVEFDSKFLSHEDMRQDGSTCVFALCQPLGGAEGCRKGYKVTVCNVGDSRAILIRSNGRMIPLTADHKPENAAERRRIRLAGGYVKQNRVDGQLALSRAFGDWSYKNNPSLSYQQQKVTAIPDITNDIMYEGDTLLICCDGLFEQLTREAVAKFVFETFQNDSQRDPAAVVAALLDEVLKCGSKDNMSCVCVRMQNGRHFAGKKNEYVPGRFHEYKNEQKFVKAFFADAKKSGLSRQKVIAMIPPPEDEPEEPKNMAIAANRDLTRHLVVFAMALGFLLFIMPEQRVLMLLLFFVIIGLLANYPLI